MWLVKYESNRCDIYVAVFWNLYQGHCWGQMREISLRFSVLFKRKNYKSIFLIVGG